MGFVIAAVVLAGGLCLINLLVTFAVLRRLRIHAEELAELRAGGGGGRPGYGLDGYLGRSLPEFAARSVRGDQVSRPDLVGRTRLVGFFTSTCGPCRARAPELAEWARGAARVAGDPAGPAVAFVKGTGAGADELVAILGDAVTVIREPDSSAVVEALGVTAFPTFLRLAADGSIADADISMRVAAALVSADQPG